MATNELKQILLIDDDLSIRFVIKKLISKVFNNIQIFTTSDTAQGLGYAFLMDAEVIIVDTTLPKYGGLEVLEYIKSNNRLNELQPKIIVLFRDPKHVDTSCNYVFIDKDDPHLITKLLDEVSHRLEAKIIPNYRLLAWLEGLGQQIVNLADRSDVAYDNVSHTQNVFHKLTNSIRWFIYQGLTTVALGLFYILGGKYITELNPAQQKNDIRLFNFRFYPTIATFFAALLFMCFQGSIFLTSFVTLFQSQVRPVIAASYTWDGGGTDGTCGGNAGDGNKWSCAANWSSDIVPTSADTVTFNATSTKNAFIDVGFQGTIVSLTISSGYTGTITLQRGLTITSASSNSYSQADGTFDSTNQAITFSVSGGFTLNTGAIFTASSATQSFPGPFTINGGTFNHNNGTITFDGGTATLSCNNVTFNLVTFNNSGTKTVNSTCSLPLGASPTLAGAGSVSVSGTLSGSGTLTKTSATFILSTGATLSGFSGLSLFELTLQGATANFGSYSTFVTGGAVLLSSGSLTLPNGADLNSALVISAGIFNAPSGVMTLAGALTISGSPTFNHNNGTVTFDGAGGTLACNNVVFNLVVIANTSSNKVVSSNCTFPLGNNPTLSRGVTLSGVLSGSGTLTTTADTLTIQNGASLSGFNGLVLNGILTLTATTANNALDLSAYTTVDLNSNLVINTPTIPFTNTFTAPSGLMTIAGSLTISGGTFNHNNGTITFDGTAGGTFDCNNVTFNLVTFNHSVNRKTVNSTCTLPLGANPTVPFGLVLNGTLSGTGTLTLTSASTLTITAGGLSGFSGISTAQNFTVQGPTINLSGYTSFSATATVTLVSGALSLPSGADLNSALTISGGTFTAPSGNMTVAGGLTISGSPTFNHNNGTVTFDGTTATLSCNNVTFNLVSFTGQTATKTVNSNCSLPLGNNPTTGNSITLNGTLSGTGTLTLPSTSALTMNTGAVLSGFSGLNAGTALIVAGANVDLSGYSTFTAGAAGGTTTLSSGSLSLPSGSDINGSLSVTGGTFTAPSGTMFIQANFTVSGSPTFNANGGTISFDGGSIGTLSCNNVTFNLVKFESTSVKTVNSNCNLPLGNNPIAVAGIILNGTLTGTGTFNFPNISLLTLNAGATLSGFSGLTLNQLTNAGATTNLGSYSPFTASGAVTLSSGTLTLPSGADLNSSLTISGGTFNAPSGVMTLAGALTISGSPTFNHNNGTLSFDSITTATLSCNNVAFNLVKFEGTGTKTVNSNCSLPLGNNPTLVGAIVLNGTLSGSGSFNDTPVANSDNLTLNAGADMVGFNSIKVRNLTISGATFNASAYSTVRVTNLFTLSSGTFTAPATTLNVRGDWVYTGGTFNHNNGTVVWEDTIGTTTRTMSGSNTFNNLNILSNGSSTIRNFTAGTTQTVLGALTVTGPLSLASTSAGSQWNIDPQSTRTLSNFTVSDSNNINANAIQTLGLNITNGGNNTNWNFNYPIVTYQSHADGSVTTDNTPTINFTVTDPDVANTVKYQIQIDNNSDFSSPEVDFTSSLAAQGATSFTPSSPLADGSYYMRIKGIDSTNGDGGFISANNGEVAFKVDTQGPTGNFYIGFDTGTGNDHDVYLIFNASDNVSGVKEVIYSEDSSFTGISYIPYTSAVIFRLSDGYGDKTVYVKYRDNAGNESSLLSVTVNIQAQTVTPTTTADDTAAETGTGQTTYSLALLFLSPDKSPLSGVRVLLGGQEAFTDTNGVVVFNDLTQTEYEVLGVYDNQEFSQTVTLENSSEVFTIILDQQPRIPITFWLCMIGIMFLIIIFILLYKRKHEEPNHSTRSSKA